VGVSESYTKRLGKLRKILPHLRVRHERLRLVSLLLKDIPHPFSLSVIILLHRLSGDTVWGTAMPIPVARIPLPDMARPLFEPRDDHRQTDSGASALGMNPIERNEV
jgi:hypothetical protein